MSHGPLAEEAGRFTEASAAAHAKRDSQGEALRVPGSCQRREWRGALACAHFGSIECEAETKAESQKRPAYKSQMKHIGGERSAQRGHACAGRDNCMLCAPLPWRIRRQQACRCVPLMACASSADIPCYICRHGMLGWLQVRCGSSRGFARALRML